MDELPKLFREANILYWVKALLGFVYNVIDRAVAGTSQPPPFDIPHVRFVDAGLVLSYYQDGSKPASKAASAHAGFLLKEVIDSDGRDDDFVKYIHNMDPNPLLEPDEFRRVGWSLSLTIKNQTGNTKLLTDPQIMTHPSVSDSVTKDIFGG
ncbi:hypothetical protein EDB19DRAFT_1916527 [Suillus lakei]|nr:hypothetical protein EDB19DRAFT_1916527 [Suillus lakei]